MRAKGKYRSALAVAAGLAMAIGTTTTAAASTTGAASTGSADGVISGSSAPHPAVADTLKTAVLPPSQVAPEVSAAATTLRTWGSAFSYGRNIYPYRMVGTPPSVSTTTTVPVSIQPIKLVLADGAFAYPTGAISSTANSALFHNANFASGTTQYGDAIQRAEFAAHLKPGSHSLLGQPALKPLVTLNVPASAGHEVFARDGHLYLAVDIGWVDGQLRAMAAATPANSLPIYVAYETYLYQGGGAPGIGGYHTEVTNTTGKHTYAYASWDTGDAFGPNAANLAAMSHEVAEWFNDPYVNNVVPRWTVANQPQYGCSSVLEVGDPLVGNVFHVGGLNFQDEAFFSWFARQKPSIGLHGRYSYLGNLTTVSPSC